MPSFKEATKEVGRGIQRVGTFMFYPNSILIGEMSLSEDTINYMLASIFARFIVGLPLAGAVLTNLEITTNSEVPMYIWFACAGYLGIDTALMVLRAIGR